MHNQEIISEPFDIKNDKMTINQKIETLVGKRKKHLNQINFCIKNEEGEETLFINTFNIKEELKNLEEKNEKAIQLKNFFLLGTFLGATLVLPNSYEKLCLILKLIEDYQIFIQINNIYNEKFLISQLPKISLYPPSLKLNLEIEYAKGNWPMFNAKNINNVANNVINLLGNLNTIMEMGKSGNILNTNKIFKINGKKYSFSDKSPFLDHFLHACKIAALPEKMSYKIIVSSICDIFDMIYTGFRDETNYNSQESYELILCIDKILSYCFTKIIFVDFFSVSMDGFEKEFSKINLDLYGTIGEKNKIDSNSKTNHDNKISDLKLKNFELLVEEHQNISE